MATFGITAVEQLRTVDHRAVIAWPLGARISESGSIRDPSTTKLYDRRGYNPEKAASFFATY
jgi:hypothetical protein